MSWRRLELCLLQVCSLLIVSIIGTANASACEISQEPSYYQNNPPFSNPPYNSLYSVAALDPANVWAAGYVGLKGVFHPLVEYYNGDYWNKISAPDVSAYYNALTGISVIPSIPP